MDTLKTRGRIFGCMALIGLAGLLTLACGQSRQERPKKSESTAVELPADGAESADHATATTGEMEPVGGVLNAEQLLKNANFATIDWPNRPEWKYITATGTSMTMAAHDPGSAEPTTLRVPLSAGQYALKGDLALPANATAPVVLTVTVTQDARTAGSVYEREVQPGETVRIDETFQIKSGGAHALSFVAEMAPAAANNWNAALRFSNLQVSPAQ